MKDIMRRKALQSAPRSGRIFAAEGKQGDFVKAICGVVRRTVHAFPHGQLRRCSRPAQPT
jgi:hypothetical protein